MMAALIGRNAKPARSGLKPRISCTNRVMKKKMLNIAAATQSISPYAPERLRSRNRCSGVIGCGTRRSLTRNAASSTTARLNAVSVTASVQPWSEARMKPYTRETMPAVAVKAPVRSKRPGCCSDSLM